MIDAQSEAARLEAWWNRLEQHERQAVCRSDPHVHMAQWLVLSLHDAHITGFAKAPSDVSRMASPFLLMSSAVEQFVRRRCLQSTANVERVRRVGHRRLAVRGP